MFVLPVLYLDPIFKGTQGPSVSGLGGHSEILRDTIQKSNFTSNIPLYQFSSMALGQTVSG